MAGESQDDFDRKSDASSWRDREVDTLTKYSLSDLKEEIEKRERKIQDNNETILADISTSGHLEQLSKYCREVKYWHNKCEDYAEVNRKLIDGIENLLGHLNASLQFPHKSRIDLESAEKSIIETLARVKEKK